MTARRLALVLVLYLAADFVDASAPGVFFFDSALFLGTVVQSKARGADAVHHAHDAYTAVADEFAAATDERSSTDRVRRTPVVVATYAPFARDATFNSPPPATAEDH